MFQLDRVGGGGTNHLELMTLLFIISFTAVSFISDLIRNCKVMNWATVTGNEMMSKSIASQEGADHGGRRGLGFEG